MRSVVLIVSLLTGPLLCAETPAGLAGLSDDSVSHVPERDWTRLGIRTWEMRNLERVKASGGIEAYNVAYESGDLNMTGFLAYPSVKYDPRGEPEEKFPAIILCHDGRQGVTTPWREVAMEFARRGYVAAAPTFRGQGGPEGRSQGVFEFAKGEVIDMLQMTQLVRKLVFVDSMRMAAIGSGHGGSVLAESLGRSNVFRAAVVISPMLFSASPEYRYAGLQNFRTLTRDLFGSSFSESQLLSELRAREAFEHIPKIQTPVLVMTTGADQGLAETLQWVEALNAKGIPNQLLRYPSMFPGFVTAVDNGTRPSDWQVNRDNAWTNIFRWMDHYIKGEDPQE